MILYLGGVMQGNGAKRLLLQASYRHEHVQTKPGNDCRGTFAVGAERSRTRPNSGGSELEGIRGQDGRAGAIPAPTGPIAPSRVNLNFDDSFDMAPHCLEQSSYFAKLPSTAVDNGLVICATSCTLQVCISLRDEREPWCYEMPSRGRLTCR